MSTSGLVADLLHRFFRALDRREYDDLLLLLTADGIWHRQGEDLTRAAVLPAMAKRSATMVIRHVVTNIVVDGDDERAEVSFLLTVYRSDGGTMPNGPLPLEGPAQISDGMATLVRDSGDWRISRLTLPPPVLRRP